MQKFKFEKYSKYNKWNISILRVFALVVISIMAFMMTANAYDLSKLPVNSKDKIAILSSNVDLDRDFDPVLLDSLASLINPDSLESYILALQAFPPRVVETEANIQSRDWLMAKLEEFGYTPVIDSFVFNDINIYNVVAYLEGTVEADRYIVIGAHFDAVPGSPGVIDDGSGCAGILEIARILRNFETNVTFQFVLYDAEEVGSYGSYFQADRANDEEREIIVMLNMDNIGYYENTNIVRLHHGPDVTYSSIYIFLSNMLPSIKLTPYFVGHQYIL
jgi:hypothetical protein